MANISYIANRVWTGGDLPSDLGEEAMLADLADIQAAGITDILDNRIEWSDEEFVRTHAPNLGFMWNGADDAGQLMPDEWFDAGVEFALDALEGPGRAGAGPLSHGHQPRPVDGVGDPAGQRGGTRRRADRDPPGPTDCRDRL